MSSNARSPTHGTVSHALSSLHQRSGTEGPNHLSASPPANTSSESSTSASSTKSGNISVDVGDIATITKKKPKNFSGVLTEMLTDSDLYELEIHDVSITPQQRATLIGTLLMLDYMFFERDIDMCGIDGNGKPYINLCNMYC